jgi:iron complex outermembrane receptor protein
MTDAGAHARHNLAAYIELDATPAPRLTLDLAGRYEHFSDFGDTTVGKLTGRYELSPAFALRGTASTGFRAPTLAEEFYSATNVQPNSAFVQLPPNAPAARLIGIDPLKAETSTNFSVGFVAHPTSSVLVTLDAYQISIRNRVVGSGTLYGTYAGVLQSAAVNAAITANGNVLENVPFSGINVFTNGIDTRTRGAELVLTTASGLGEDGRIDWTLAANYNTTKVTGVRATPPQLAASGQNLFDKVAISTLETASPKVKVILDGLYSHGRWSVDLKETFYGQASRYADPGDGNLYLDKEGAKFLTDLEISYRLGGGVTVSAGADNLFNVYPDHVNAAGLRASGLAGNPAVEIYPAFSAIGIDGGFYFGKVRYQF